MVARSTARSRRGSPRRHGTGWPVIRELRPGLFRWTAIHPEWRPDARPDSPADWPQSVGSVLVDTAQATVFIDPLIGDNGPSWQWFDRHVSERALPVLVLTTIGFHRRSRDDIAARYGATIVAGAEIVARRDRAVRGPVRRRGDVLARGPSGAGRWRSAARIREPRASLVSRVVAELPACGDDSSQARSAPAPPARVADRAGARLAR